MCKIPIVPSMAAARYTQAKYETLPDFTLEFGHARPDLEEMRFPLTTNE